MKPTKSDWIEMHRKLDKQIQELHCEVESLRMSLHNAQQEFYDKERELQEMKAQAFSLREVIKRMEN